MATILEILVQTPCQCTRIPDAEGAAVPVWGLLMTHRVTFHVTEQS